MTSEEAADIATQLAKQIIWGRTHKILPRNLDTTNFAVTYPQVREPILAALTAMFVTDEETIQ